MKKPCKNYLPATCKIKGCEKLHLKKTCLRDVKDGKCKFAHEVISKEREMHVRNNAHQLDCDDDDWMQRYTFFFLMRAHYDGRYR